MATKKPKSSAKTTKSAAKTTKPKTTAAKTVSKPVSEASKTKTVEKVETSKKGKSCFSGFFGKKYEEKEGILTVFKSHKFYGALLGEIIGTGFLTILMLALTFIGLANLATFGWALIAILIAVYAFSGACLNPLITVGMMATRRMSVIRGVMYIIAEIIGAWVGWLILNAFHSAGGEMASQIQTMTLPGDEQFWIFAMLELLGAVIIAFFFARALKYKRSVFTFAAVVSGGIILAVIAGYIISYAFAGVQGNYIFNPAIALMSQIFPTSGGDFGEIMSGVGQSLTIYVLFPAVGGVCGFYLSDFLSKLNAED